MRTRVAVPDDAAAIARIYNQGMEERVATFETRPRTPEDVRAWFDGVHPIVVVVEAGQIAAFASTSSISSGRKRTREPWRASGTEMRIGETSGIIMNRNVYSDCSSCLVYTRRRRNWDISTLGLWLSEAECRPHESDGL